MGARVLVLAAVLAIAQCRPSVIGITAGGEIELPEPQFYSAGETIAGITAGNEEGFFQPKAQFYSANGFENEIAGITAGNEEEFLPINPQFYSNDGFLDEIIGITSGNEFQPSPGSERDNPIVIPPELYSFSTSYDTVPIIPDEPLGITANQGNQARSPTFYSADSDSTYLGVRGGDLSYHVNPPSGSLVSADPEDISIRQNHYYAPTIRGFSHFGGPNSRIELRDEATGAVTGSFNYIDAFGEVQTRYYTADDKGFRVHGTDIY